MRRKISKEQQLSREHHSGPRVAPIISIEEARRRRPALDWADYQPPTANIHRRHKFQTSVPLECLVPLIDWTPFFHAWELKGIYPRIFDDPVVGPKARELFDDAQQLLDEIVTNKLLTARGVAGFFPANSVGDDIELYADASRTRLLATFYTLRQQMQKPENEPAYALADFIAPRDTGLADYLGAFAVTAGIGTAELAARFEKANDDYNAIMAKALADRLAEAFAEWMHKQARDAWGFGTHGKSDARGFAARALSRHSARAGLSRFARPHRKNHSVPAARRGKGDGHSTDGKFRHAAGGLGVRPVFFASRLALFRRRKNRPRPGARLPAPQRTRAARHRTLARPVPQLRARLRLK